MDSDIEGGKPEWWIENEQIRRAYDLPEYDPPKFDDGTYLHNVVPELESAHNCTIQLIGVNTEYLDDWEVRVDEEVVFTVGHRRDENGNTVYEIDPRDFVHRIERHFDPA